MAPTPHESRAAGLDLWDASHQYGKTLVYAAAGLETMFVVGMVGRSRAFLRAAFALADDGYELEAMLQVRALWEYVITLRWLVADPEYNALLLAIDNVRALLNLDKEARELPHGLAILEDETRAEYEAGRNAYKADLDALRTEGDRRPEKLPQLIDRAKAAKMMWVYSVAYRADSQAAAHPTVWAFEQFAESAPDGQGIVFHDRVAPGRPVTNPYKAAVPPFAWILMTAAEQARDAEFADRIAAIVARLPGGVGGWPPEDEDIEDGESAES